MLLATQNIRSTWVRLANASGTRFRLRLLLKRESLQPFGGNTKCKLDSLGPQEPKPQCWVGQLRSCRSFQRRGQPGVLLCLRDMSHASTSFSLALQRGTSIAPWQSALCLTKPP